MNAARRRLCLMIPGHWSALMGGAQYQVKCLVEALIASQRYDLYVITRDAAPSYQAKGYTLVRADSRERRQRGLRRLANDYREVMRALQRIRPDVIYQRVGCAYTGIATHYARRHGCRTIWHIASEPDVTGVSWRVSKDVFYRVLDRAILDYGIRHVDCIVAQHEQQADLLKAHFNRSPTAVIRNFHPLPVNQVLKHEPVKVAWVANLKSVKRPELFLDLARDLLHLADVRFILVGAVQGSTRWREELTARMALLPNLEYRGPLSQQEVNRMLAGVHLLVNTSEREGFPNTFVQAWMHEVPVVSLNVDPEGVMLREGLGLRSGSYRQLVHDVAHLAQDHAIRKAMGVRARAYAIKYHSVANIEALRALFDA